MEFKSLFRKKSIHQIQADFATGYGDSEKPGGLRRTLSLRDLTVFGIAAIIGGGIFTSVGAASANGGPAIILLYLGIAVACGFAAVCYAEFASMIPIAGSAYTYSYAAFGEIIAWIIGWDLLMEYSIGNIAVAIPWSTYFTTFLEGFNIHVADAFTTDYMSAHKGFNAVSEMLSSGTTLDSITDRNLMENYNAWLNAPKIAGLRFIADIPAICIVILITYIVYRGIKESRTTGNLLVLFKLIVLMVVIALGGWYVNPDNWNPFSPEGALGVLKGVNGVFFAYIGFDAISTTAEEAKNPQRDLPRSMMYSLVICAVLYALIALVLTGMIHYKNLNVPDPIAEVFKGRNMDWFVGVISFSAIIATTSVLLVFQLGQPRIWMSMSRDGLLPKKFSDIHPKYKTPAFATIITGLFVAVPILFLNYNWVLDLASLGTLAAFALVCGGLLILHTKKDLPDRKFKVTQIDAKFYFPIAVAIMFWFIYEVRPDLFDSISNGTATLKLIYHHTPLLFFMLMCVVLCVYAFIRRLSLIPAIGLMMCAYLMTESNIKAWERFMLWMSIGLIIYFGYSYWNSKLNKSKETNS